MTFTRRKKSPPGASEKSGRSYVVSVRLNEEQYQTVQESCRKSGRKLSDFWRHALLNAKVMAVATPDDMAILRQIGSMANNLNQLAKKANEAGFKLVEWSLKGLSKEIKRFIRGCRMIGGIMFFRLRGVCTRAEREKQRGTSALFRGSADRHAERYYRRF